MNFLHNKFSDNLNSYHCSDNYKKYIVWLLAVFWLLVFGSYFYATNQIILVPLAIAAAPTSGLIGYWNFDDGTGTTVADTSGNGINGTLTNAPTWIVGKVGSGALQFTGTNYVSVPNSAALSGGSGISISFWVNTDAIASKSVLSKRHNASPYYSYN